MNTQNANSDLIGQRKIRLEKVKKLRDMGIDPYPSDSNKTHDIQEIINEQNSFLDKEVVLAGRIMSWRGHGHLNFCDIQDQDGQIQVYIKEDCLKDTNVQTQNLGFNNLNLLDIGDFIEVKGTITQTQSGELSILATEINVLSKSIRPLPNLQNGLKDKEEIFRRRYIDMTLNKSVREMFERKAKFWQAHRDFFNRRGFSEVNIPVLEHIPGGGDAVPFVTHMNAIDEDLFLRISHELPLKRLIGGNFDKVYDIGHRFRNEGLSDEHLPEHVAMEFYWAYANWQDGMKLVKELINYIVEKVYDGRKKFSTRGFDIDFSKEWEIIDFGEIMKERFGINDVYTVSLEEVKQKLTEANIDYDEKVNIPRGVDSLWKSIRKSIAGPAFLINHPKYLSPLQKPSKDNPLMVERFQPIIAGSEAGNGWSEVNDAVDQYERFVEQQNLRDSGDDEAQWLDIDFVEMLEYGMPPTFGYGHSERLFWFLEDVTAREGVPFPQLKFSISNLTKKIYHEIDFDNVRNTDLSKSESSLKADLSKVANLNLVSIAHDVVEKFEGIKTGYIVLENTNVTKSNNELQKLKKEIEKLVKAKYSDVSKIKEDENISGFRELYKNFGVDPNSRLNSSESLLRRVVQDKGLYNINTVVDAYNATSIEFALPMAAYDLDHVDGEITLRFAKENDTITKILETEPTQIDAGELVYSDSQGVICMDYNYRDSDRTKITENTKRIIVFVDGHEGISEQMILEALSVLAYRLEKFTGGKVVGKGLVPAQASLGSTTSASQDMSKKTVIVVNETLENWKAMNAIGHLSAMIGHELGDNFSSSENFVTKDHKSYSRPSQYPIIILKGSESKIKELQEASKSSSLISHSFLEEMLEIEKDEDVQRTLEQKTSTELKLYALVLHGERSEIDSLTNSKFSLWS